MVVVLTEKFLHFVTEVNTLRYVINRQITQAKKSERYERIVILEENVLWSINIKTKEIWRENFNDDHHITGAKNITFEIYEDLGMVFCLREIYNYDNENYEFVGVFSDIESGNITHEFNTAFLGIKISNDNNRRNRGSRNRTSDSLFLLMEELQILAIFLADSVLVLAPFDTVCKLVSIIPLKDKHKTKFKYAHFTHQDSNNIYFLSYDIGFRIDIKNNIVDCFKGFSFFIQDMIVNETNKTLVFFDSENCVSLYGIENNEILTSFDLKSIDVKYDSDALAKHYDFENDMLFLSTSKKVIIISLRQEKNILNLNTIFQFLSIAPTTKNLYMLGDNKGFIYEVALENYLPS